jgi:hypothetical protein
MENKYFEWISIEDETPNDSERVLIKKLNRSCWEWEVAVWNNLYEVWDDAEGDDYMCNKESVTHWMRIK